jgi:hypothetical protein
LFLEEDETVELVAVAEIAFDEAEWVELNRTVAVVEAVAEV